MDTQSHRMAENRYGQRQSPPWHVAKGSEAAVVDLLLAAFEVQFHVLHQFGIVKIGHTWVVECDVPIFPDAEKDNINGLFNQETRITGAHRFQIGLVSRNWMKASDLNVIQQMAFEVGAETSGIFVRQSDVFI